LDRELIEKINALNPEASSLSLGDTITIELGEGKSAPLELLYALKPWRKGPFKVGNTLIDSEWQSFIKYNLIKEHLDIEGKDVLDIGCSNGYYSFRMLEKNPASITCIDPSQLFYLQFLLINKYINSGIDYRLLGINDIGTLGKMFDTMLCLGILYHRHNPIEQLKNIKNFLKKDGYLIVDNLIIEDEKEIVLSPKKSYAKMKNCYFIPSMSAFIGWLQRAGYRDIEVIATKKTDFFEQRKTEWIDGESLEDFLDKNDTNLTIEGYPAPIRAYIKARR